MIVGWARLSWLPPSLDTHGYAVVKFEKLILILCNSFQTWLDLSKENFSTYGEKFVVKNPGKIYTVMDSRLHTATK